MSAAASLVILLVILTRLFMKRSPKIFSYVLWLAVLIRLLCPFSIKTTISSVPAEFNADELIAQWAEAAEDSDAFPIATMSTPCKAVSRPHRLTLCRW